MEWFNQVDATYRADLRHLNDLNFGRFDATLEQRFAEQDARIDRRFAEFEVKMERRFAEMEVKFEKRLGALEATIERRFAEQTRFLYLALAAQMALIAGLYLR